MDQSSFRSATRFSILSPLPAGLFLAGLLSAAVLLGGVTGCKDKPKKTTASTEPAAAPAGSPMDPSALPAAGATSGELSSSLAALYEHSLPPASFSFFGVKIGDPETALAKDDITGPPDASGWVGYKKHDSAFRVDNGKVMQIHITDPSLLNTLGLGNEAAVAGRFGKPDQVIEAGPDAPEAGFVFNSRWVTLWWNRAANAPKSVTITYNEAAAH